MTVEQFEALVKLMRGRLDTAANRAARMVLCDGKAQAEAARETGATRQTVSDAVRRWHDADQLIRDVYGVTE